MSLMESDLRRMVGNAKSFNQKSSPVFSDAEKMRKTIVAFMTINNPAYKTGNYAPGPTPVPEGWQSRLEVEKAVEEADAEGETDHEEPSITPQLEEPTKLRKRTAPAAQASVAQSSHNRRASSTPAVQDAEGAGESFEGDTFQRAQEKIMTEMINLTNDESVIPVLVSVWSLTQVSSDELISSAFLNLPSRELRDYYRVIKHPVCLRSVQKLVRGVKGREKPTGHTLLKSWQAFEDESNHIWNNAREYNEDGSVISDLATQLESYFRRRLKEAKRFVQEPPQPKVKLRMPAPDPPTKITLKFGGQKQTGSTGVSIDSESLKRQQELVNAGANGKTSATDKGTPVIRERPRSDSADHPVINGVKKESALSQSPTLGAVQVNGDFRRPNARQSPNSANMAMPPPLNNASRMASGSPLPQAPVLNNHIPTSHAPTNTTAPFDNRWRPQGKDASDALFSNLNISTHPGLKVDRPFQLDIPPSSTATQQSVTISLPSTHFFLRLRPTLAPSLMTRPSKIFVTANMQRLNPIPERPEETNVSKPLYEARVTTGSINRIEIEVVAGTPRGVPKVGNGPEIEMEKITLFVSLTKT
ncbi:MAG: hypothetical protein Q9195_008610 [Heterodermia aff. obscurata]